MSQVAIIGNGNVGYHLLATLPRKHDVSLFSRNPREPAKSLQDLEPANFEFIILAIPDDAIEEVSNSLGTSNAIVLHTSGSRPIKDLAKHERRGVMYPFQTFSKEKEINFNSFPILIEGTDETEKEIFSFARSFGTDVRLMSSGNRAKLHLAAVFACNFTNHLYTIAESILSSMEMPLKDLEHLAKETLEKAVEMSAAVAQTGPAVRNDLQTIQNHLAMIENEDWKKVYELLSADIRKLQK